MRRLLVLYGLAMTSVVLVAFLVPLGLLARSLAQERALDAGQRDAQRVAVFAGGATFDDARLQATLLAVNDGPRRTTAFMPTSTTVGAPAARSSSVTLAQAGRALTARTAGGVEILVPVGGPDGIAVVRTFVPDSELDAGVRQSWLILAGVGTVLLAGTVVAGDRIAHRLARSVDDLARVAERLGDGDLSARVEPSGPPEVASVGRVLNGLGARVAELVAAERELVADLSHRLRTPITALRLDVELLGDAQERDRMTEHVDQLVNAVDAIIWTARHPLHDVPDGRCDAALVVRERAGFWAVLAADQGRELRVDVPATPCAVGVRADQLGAALDVLVDNVFSHTPDRTPFELTVQGGEVVRVVVADAGPGFASVHVAGRGLSGTGSTGLGLDVARRTVEQAGGTLHLGVSPHGGALIVLEFPADGLTKP